MKEMLLPIGLAVAVIVSVFLAVSRQDDAHAWQVCVKSHLAAIGAKPVVLVRICDRWEPRKP